MAITLFLGACSSVPNDSAVEKKVKLDNEQATQVQPKPTIPTIDTSVKSTPVVRSLLDSAHAKKQNGEIITAIGLLERAIRIAPRYPESYLRLAEIRFQQQEYHQAKSLSHKSLSLGATGDIQEQAQQLLLKINK